MLYHIGTWLGSSVVDAPPLFIYWGDGVYYDVGWNPKVAFFSGGQVMEVHNGSGWPGPMWYHYGSWNGGPAPAAPVLDNGATLNMGGSYEYDWGWNPSVAASGIPGSAVEVHNGSGSAGPMWYHAGSILAYSNPKVFAGLPALEQPYLS
jgi:hypothetical protein